MDYTWEGSHELVATSATSEPLWQEEFSVRTADERYVNRRQLTKFLVLTSLGMFVGNMWILIRSLFYKAPSTRSSQWPTRRDSGRRSEAIQLSDKRRPLHHDPHRARTNTWLQPEMHSSFMRGLLFAGGKQT